MWVQLSPFRTRLSSWHPRLLTGDLPWASGAGLLTLRRHLTGNRGLGVLLTVRGAGYPRITLAACLQRHISIPVHQGVVIVYHSNLWLRGGNKNDHHP